MIQDDAVDDTKAGDRVPQFYRRQGGSAADWSVPGTTTYTPAAVTMQGGSIKWSGSASNNGTIVVTFPVAFGVPPLVVATATADTLAIQPVLVSAVDPSASAVTLFWWDVSGTRTQVTIDWLAIGPEAPPK
jgi:hypothetical protein